MRIGVITFPGSLDDRDAQRAIRLAGGEPVALPIPPGGFHDVGLSFVHQDLGLARPLTVLENLVGAAARAEYSRFRVDWRAEAVKARAMLESYGVTIDPRTVVNELPPVGQALIAIARRPRARTRAAAASRSAGLRATSATSAPASA